MTIHSLPWPNEMWDGDKPLEMGQAIAGAWPETRQETLAVRRFLADADAYIVALGWVVRGPQASPGRKLLGVLYGAGPVPSLDHNSIYARWLQKRVMFVAEDGRRFPGTKSLGPDRQLLALPAAGPITGRFEVYGEDGVTLLGTSAGQAVSRGQSFNLR